MVLELIFRLEDLKMQENLFIHLELRAYPNGTNIVGRAIDQIIFYRLPEEHTRINVG
jgi:hypothetical protein